MHNGAFVLSSIYPLVAGWLLGMRIGLLYWLFHSALLMILALMVGRGLDDFIYGGLPSYIFTLLLTAGIGRISDLTRNLRYELKERKRFESELQQYKQNLEKLVKKRTEELIKTNERLKQEIMEREKTNIEKQNLEINLQRAEKMEALGIIAGSVAHDLNNILSGIMNYPELMLLDIPEDSPLRKPILTIQNSGEKAAAVVQDLLTLARRGVIATQVININQIISDFLKSPEFLKLNDDYPGINIETHTTPHLLNIHGSPIHLSKAIMNLISNSMEAMKRGDQLIISTANVYIDKPRCMYRVLEEGDYVTVKISDTGEGIPEEYLDKIFEPFYTKKVMGRSGTGLGLSIVWGTIKDHKGYVDVQSVAGEGTTFTLYFPATREDMVSKDPNLKWEHYTGNGESILVIDDIELQRDVCTSILKKLGYSVRSVSSGEEAVEYLQNNSADLLVLDMIMNNGINGVATYERVIAIHPAQKAIIVSGFAESEQVKKVQALGAGAFVRKPYTLEKMGIAVKNELQKNEVKDGLVCV
jgi:two-component system cell cycle sensor histidine kinase/response regulator CckA